MDAPELSFADIALRSGLSKSTAHRLLGTLEHDRMIEFDDQKNAYRLGRGVLRLGNVAATGTELLKHADPILTRLAQETGETSLLFIPNGLGALCVLSREGARAFAPAAGTQFPFNCGAAQRVLLAHRPEPEWNAIVAGDLQPQTRYSLVSAKELERDRLEIVQRGYAMGWEDASLYACDVAAPVRNPRHEVVAAVSVSGTVQRFSADRLPILIQGVVAAGEEISGRLG